MVRKMKDGSVTWGCMAWYRGLCPQKESVGKDLPSLGLFQPCNRGEQKLASCRAAASVHEAFSQALIGNKKPCWPLAWRA